MSEFILIPGKTALYYFPDYAVSDRVKSETMVYTIRRSKNHLYFQVSVDIGLRSLKIHFPRRKLPISIHNDV